VTVLPDRHPLTSALHPLTHQCYPALSLE